MNSHATSIAKPASTGAPARNTRWRKRYRFPLSSQRPPTVMASRAPIMPPRLLASRSRLEDTRAGINCCTVSMAKLSAVPAKVASTAPVRTSVRGSSARATRKPKGK